MSLYLVGFAVLTSRLEGRPCLVWLAPTVWVGLDWLRSWLFTGFPWHGPGLQPVPLSAADPGRRSLRPPRRDLSDRHGQRHPGPGVRNFPRKALPAFPARVRPWSRPCCCWSWRRVTIWSATHQIESAMSGAEHLKVAVIQGNIDQDEKWRPANQGDHPGKISAPDPAGTGRKIPRTWWSGPRPPCPSTCANRPALLSLENLADHEPEPTSSPAPPTGNSTATGKTVKYYNSAFLINRPRRGGRPLRQGASGALRRICAPEETALLPRPAGRSRGRFQPRHRSCDQSLVRTPELGY